MPDTIDGFEPEPDDHADAVFDEASEIAGLHVRLLIGITEYVYQHRDDKDALDGIEQVWLWKPKYLVKAYERFPKMFDSNDTGSLSWGDIVACWTLGKAKNDETAQKLYHAWRDNTWDLAQLRDAVKAANGTREHKPTLAERCAELVQFARLLYRDDKQNQAGMYIADKLAELPEVAKVLKNETA